MVREGNSALVRSWTLFGGAVGSALALVMPLLVGTAVEGVGGGAALVALVVAVLLASGHRYVVLAVRAFAGRAGRAYSPHIRLHGNITDPPHHPVRPRAPGLA